LIKKRGNCLYLENENTLRTDSQDYGVDEILYSAGIALFEKKTIGQYAKLELF
jgi:hypothetical protein